MAFFLAKTDPQVYSIVDLEKEQETTWDGVRSPQAIQAIKNMRPGDQVLIYHSQGEAALVGLARVTCDPRPDAKDPKSWVVDLAFVRRLNRPVSLREIKETHRFDDWSLVRQSRLSTMTAPEAFIAWLQEQDIL